MKGKVAVIFGGSGATGRAIANSFAKEGICLYIGARNQNKLDQVAKEIRGFGGWVETFTIDVLDENTMNKTMEQLVERIGSPIDIVVNATSFMHDQGKMISELNLSEFMQGITPFISAQFNISKAVIPHMGGTRCGTIISIVAPSGSVAIPGHLGHIVGCSSIESFIKALASEVGPKNIRVVGVRSHAIADAVQAGSYTRQLFDIKAKQMGLTTEDWLNGAAQSTMLKRLPTLSQIAETVKFLASDHASAITATIINVTAGSTIIS